MTYTPAGIPGGGASLDDKGQIPIVELPPEVNEGIMVLRSPLGKIVQKILPSAPSDSVLNAGEIAFYLDETGNFLKYKLKESDGTVGNGTVGQYK